MAGCPNPYNGGSPDPVDPAFWFGEVYEPLLIRVGEVSSADYSGPTGGNMGQIANCQFVCDKINEKWGVFLGNPNLLTPAPGTELQVANCEYLLKAIDRVNNSLIKYGDSKYATQQIVDVDAVMDATGRLWKAGQHFIVNNSSIAIYPRTGVYFSLDGIHWNFEYKTPNDVYPYHYGLYTAYGDGLYISGSGYSLNGFDWTRIPSKSWNEAYSTTARAVYGNGKWVVEAGQGGLHYSTDGMNWMPAGGTTRPYGDVAYGNGRFVAIWGYGLAYSSDGISWTERTFSGNHNFYRIAYGNGRFVIVGSSPANGQPANNLMYSSDGINWTARRMDNVVLSGVTYGGMKFVAVGVSSYPTPRTGFIMYSSDGINWTRKTITELGDRGFDSITYGNGLYVAVSVRTGLIAYSPDGINWTIVSGLSISGNGSICFGGY